MGPPPLPQASPAKGVLLALPSVDPLVADDADLTCPLCGYDLRGLPEPRCPECGHAFDPAELRAASVNGSQWFFEHTRRQRLRRFFQTAYVSLAPAIFWRRVSPSDRGVGSRMLWWSVAWLLPAMTVSLVAFAEAIAARIQVTWILGSSLNRPGAWHRVLDEAWHYDKLGASLAALPLLVVAWPACVVIAMRAFSVTLRRAGIRSHHCWRCAIYALPTVVSIYAAGVLMLQFPEFDAYRLNLISLSTASAIETLGIRSALAPWLLISATLSTVHLVFAHRQYLRLPHPLTHALLISTMAWLMFLIGIIALSAA